MKIRSTFIKSFAHDTRGATAIEYGLIAGILCVALITCFSLFSNSATSMVEYTANVLEEAMTK